MVVHVPLVPLRGALLPEAWGGPPNPPFRTKTCSEVYHCIEPFSATPGTLSHKILRISWLHEKSNCKCQSDAPGTGLPHGTQKRVCTPSRRIRSCEQCLGNKRQSQIV